MSSFFDRVVDRVYRPHLDNFKERINEVDILKTCLDKVRRERRPPQDDVSRPILEQDDKYCDTKNTLLEKVENLEPKPTQGEQSPDETTQLQNWYKLVRFYYDIKNIYTKTFTVFKEEINVSDKPKMYELICSLLDEYIDKHLFKVDKHLFKESNFVQLLTNMERILGKDDPKILVVRLNRLALVYYSKGEFEEALPLYDECLEKRKRVLGDDHPDTLASLNNLANVYYSKGEFEEALPLYEKCLKARKSVLGEKHPATLATLKKLETLHLIISNRDDGIKRLQQEVNQNAGRNKNKSKNKVYSSKHKRKYFQSRRRHRRGRTLHKRRKSRKVRKTRCRRK